MSMDFSVVVPTYQRASLNRCLEALAAQSIDLDRFEVIVSDDGSAVPVVDRFSPILAKLEERLRIRVVRGDNAGPAAARNRGAEVASGRLLAFTDDDCLPRPDWLFQLLAEFERTPDALLGGPLECPPSADPFALANDSIMRFVYAHQERVDALRLFSTSNLALPRDAFSQLGGFSTDFRFAGGEDYDLCARWHGDGRPSRLAPKAIVQHDHPLDLRGFWRQHFVYGRGLLQMRQRMKAAALPSPDRSHGLMPGGYYAALVLSPVRDQGFEGAARSGRIALSQAATAAGALTQWLATGR